MIVTDYREIADAQRQLNRGDNRDPSYWRDALVAYDEMRDAWRADPVLYMRTRIGMNPTRQQAQLLEALAPFGARVTVRAGHEVGKTTAVAAAIWWHLECFEHSKTPCTSPTASQLYQVLWSELGKLMRRSDEQADRVGLESVFKLSSLFRMIQDMISDSTPGVTDWFAVARTSRKEKPDAFQGFHATDLEITADDVAVHRSDAGGSIMLVIDEASGVPDEIMEVVEGALAGRRCRLLMVGNPVRNTGFFARSHTRDRALFTALHFKCSDSPLPAPDFREKLVRKYGEGSNVVRVRADGEFPSQDDDVLIPLEFAEMATTRELPPGTDDDVEEILGIDVARFGNDRTTFVCRKGRRVTFIDVIAKKDTMFTVGHALNVIEKRGIRKVNVDVIGVGSGVVDRLREVVLERRLDVVVTAVNVAEAATFAPKVRTRLASRAPQARFTGQDALPRLLRDYVWQEAAAWLREEEPSFVEAGDFHAQTLAAELCTVRYTLDSSGRLVVESKDSLRDRDVDSPDVAEGLLMTFAPDDTRSVWEKLV